MMKYDAFNISRFDDEKNKIGNEKSLEKIDRFTRKHNLQFKFYARLSYSMTIDESMVFFTRRLKFTFVCHLNELKKASNCMFLLLAEIVIVFIFYG